MKHKKTATLLVLSVVLPAVLGTTTVSAQNTAGSNTDQIISQPAQVSGTTPAIPPQKGMMGKKYGQKNEQRRERGEGRGEGQEGEQESKEKEGRGFGKEEYKQKSNQKIIKTLNDVGDGQPVIAGVIKSVDGTTITVSNKSNITYTVNTANAKINRATRGSTGTTTLAVGDSVAVQGAVNGTSITASLVVAQPVPPAKKDGATAPAGKVFGKVGNFFAKIFGF